MEFHCPNDVPPPWTSISVTADDYAASSKWNYAKLHALNDPNEGEKRSMAGRQFSLRSTSEGNENVAD